MKDIKKYVVFIIPLLYLAWSLQINGGGGPFSLTRSDPEYPYLLNGLNCATLNFNNIGHTDHPGTPFQILTGIFIRATHLFIGHGPIQEDVMSRPETYLASASFFLSLLTFFLLYWIGRVISRKDDRLLGVLILQSTFFLSNVLIDLPLRYNPDRILVLYNLILAGLTIKYLLTENPRVRNYAVLTGILMGIGFATKFNFLPVLIIPFLLIPDLRNKVVYGLTFVVTFFVSILPIINKFKEFRRFISGVASHDGLYGSGSEQVINWKSFANNFLDLLGYNPAYTVILALSAALVVYFLINRDKFRTDKLFLLFLVAFILASAAGFILVAKHFKVYYFAPVLSLSGLAFFIIWRVAESRFKPQIVKPLIFSLLGAFILVSVMPLSKQYSNRIQQKKSSMKTQQFYADQVTKKDILFIEPTWMAGPMVENALAYGISYVAHRHEFYRQYNQLYPNVITWEGPGKNPGMFRTAEADPESILYSGSDIYVYSSPGRNARQLLDYLDTLASFHAAGIRTDTVFINPDTDEKVIRVRNTEGWQTLSARKELTEVTDFTPSSPVSPAYAIREVSAGDYIEISLLIRHNDKDARCRIITRSAQSDMDGVYFEDSNSLQDIGKGWELLRLRGIVRATPADGILTCQVYYPGKNKITAQNLNIRHMGRR